MKIFFSNTASYYRHIILNAVCALLLMVNCCNTATAQCPVNLDFESGNFSGWKCYKSFFLLGGIPIDWGNPVPADTNRHLMLSSIPGNGLDYYGQFPKNCPNGSGHSIKLGNEQPGSGAERVSYTFTIPPGKNKFSLIYNYAIVLEDYGHPREEQPRFNVEVYNVTDNKIDSCSSLDFIVDGGLPGFFLSPLRQPPYIPVWCKDWAAASINLDGEQGKTFRISFSTADCAEGGHFGYAYVDVNSECSSSFINDIYCTRSTETNVKAPFGYKNYTWYDSTFTTIFGTQQTLVLRPPPPPGTKVAVVLVPYDGYGCLDTLTTLLFDTLSVNAFAGNDISSCTDATVRLGAPPKIGYTYRWNPVTGLSDPDIANPLATTTVTMEYVLTVMNIQGKCFASDTVKIERPCKDLIYVPNIFTPNKDGINDLLRPLSTGFAKVNYFRVYDRWGQLLYSINGDKPGWDGRLKGEQMGMQTVVWIMEVRNTDGIIYHQKGTTLLMR